MYAMHTWANSPATTTPLNDSRLTEMEAGIYTAHVMPVRRVATNTALTNADGNAAIEFNSSTSRSFTFGPQSGHQIPAGVFVTVSNIGTSTVTIIDNTTGANTTILSLAQGQYLRWFQSSNDIWVAPY